MSTHSAHPPIGEHGLADNCDRCNEQAYRPFENLDRQTLADLLARVERRALARSVNERIAMNVLRDVIWRAEVLASLEPVPLASRKAPAA